MKAQKTYKGGGTTGDDKPKTLKAPAKASDVNQDIARQYDLSKTPSPTERDAWNKYLNWVENTKGYTGDKALELNKGSNQFEALSSEYNNPEVLGKQYDELAAKNLGKLPAKEDWIKARQVTPEMLQNAQQFYKQQTKKDNWFGSETAQTYYPTIKPMVTKYDPKLGTAQMDKASQPGSLAPVSIIPYSKKGSAPSTPFKAVAPLSYDRNTGDAIIDYKQARDFVPSDSSKIYVDPNFANRFKDYLTPSLSTSTVVPSHKNGGIISKVKGYYDGGDVSQIGGAATDIGSGVMNMGAGYLATQAIDPETGKTNVNKAQGASALKGAATGLKMGATIGLNPAALAATGGLSALAIPAGALLGAGAGSVFGKKMAEKSNAAIDAEDKKAKDDQAAKERQMMYQLALNKQMQERQAGYKDGGKIVGPGTEKSDSILAKVKKNSFVVPAENEHMAEEIREKVLGKPDNKKEEAAEMKNGGKTLKAPSVKIANLNQKGGETVKLSNGEHLFTPEEKKKIVSELGEEVLEMLAPNADDKDDAKKNGGLTSAKAKEILHDGSVHGKKITDKQRKFFGAIASGQSVKEYMCGGDVKGYADGGPVKGQKLMYKGEEVTFNGKGWVTKDGRTTYKADLFNDYLAKQEAAKSSQEKKYNAQQVDAWKRHYDFIKNDPSRKDEAERTLQRINAATGEGIATKKGSDIEKTLSKTSQAPVIKKSKTAPDVLASKQTSLPEGGVESDIVQNNNNSQNDTVPATQKQTPKGIASADAVKIGKGLLSNVGDLANYAIPLYQAKLGKQYLAQSGKRPVDKIDPDFMSAVNKAQANARYGYTAEEQALINQQNLQALNEGRFAAKNYAGGSGANAYNMERAAANDYFGRGLKAAVENRNLQLSKQQYADQLVSQKAEMQRRLFGDTMNAWQQNQQSGSELLGAGLRNLIGAQRYNQEKAFQDNLNANNNNWMNTI